jgi:hypothetical protein
VNRDILLGLVVAAVAALSLGVLGGSGSDSSSTPSTGSGSSSDSGSGSLLDTVATSTPLPDALATTDPVIQPANAITDGAIWQGGDPLDLAPGPDGRGDLIAPFNPGNIPQEGPVYTGPDPFNLGRFTGGD